MIRLKDIALRSGVSVMTVSKVLRDAPDISAATKGRVKLIAQQMGYVPDSTAQSLRNRTTRFLGVVIPSVTDPTYTRVVLAIEERAYELGYEIILAHTLNSEEREAACIQRLLSRRVDGIFISPVYRRNPEAPVYQNLSTKGKLIIPIIDDAHLLPVRSAKTEHPKVGIRVCFGIVEFATFQLRPCTQSHHDGIPIATGPSPDCVLRRPPGHAMVQGASGGIQASLPRCQRGV